MLWFVILVATAALLYWVRWRIVNKKLLEFSDKFPGPPTIPILGNALLFMRPSEELSGVFGKLIQEYGDIFRAWFGPDMNIFVYDPDDIKTLLTSSKTSVKGPQYKYIADYCGFGILSGSGPTWRMSRKIVLPNYGKKALESYGDVINREALETVERLRAKAGGKTFDIYDDVVLGTTYTVCQTLMGLSREQTVNLPSLNSIFIHEVHEMYLVVFERMTQWYLQVEPFYRMTKYYQRQIQIIKKLNIFGDAIVQHRIKVIEEMDEDRKREILNATGDNKHNTELSVVDRLLLSGHTSYEEILKQLFTVFTSSQEATAKIASFLLLMMAYHPECQDKLYAEIQEVFGDSEREVTDEDLKLMPYLDMVFKEVARLFPIGVMLQRTIAEDITISKGTLPAGSSLIVPIFHLHRDKKHWNNPDAFDPERFSLENSRLRHPGAFMPFSLGPMDCLGRYFAYKIVKTMAVKILREFRLTSSEKYEDMRLVMAVSVASVNGYPVQLHHRK